MSSGILCTLTVKNHWQKSERKRTIRDVLCCPLLDGPSFGPHQKTVKPGEFNRGHKDSQGVAACEIQDEVGGAGVVQPGEKS